MSRWIFNPLWVTSTQGRQRRKVLAFLFWLLLRYPLKPFRHSTGDLAEMSLAVSPQGIGVSLGML